MHILILQHADSEGPGVFGDLLTEDGHSTTVVHVHAGESIPDLGDFDALWVLGGPMDVWQEEQFPWLSAEKAVIKDAVEGRGMPFLGLCLGHQLLAEALGGTVAPSKTPEIGILDVQLTELGASGVFLDGVPDQFACLQWHSAEVTQMPAGAECLATSPACPVQAMKWGPRAYSVQFHVEVEERTVADWAAIPEYAQALTEALGADAVDRLAADTAARLPAFNAIAERMYINWLQAAAQAR